MADYGLIALCILSILVAFSSCGYILYSLIKKCTVLHLSCLAGVVFLLMEDVVQLLRSLEKIWASASGFCWSYMVLSSLTSILSCYVILHLGTNFYYAYNIKKYFLLFTPIVLSFAQFIMTMLIAIKMVSQEETEPDRILAQVNMYIGTSAALFSLIYAVIPLFSIRKNKDLLPDNTAVSILRLFTILIFFFAHLITGLFIIHTQPFMELRLNSIEHILLACVFVGCVMPSPHKVIKNIKKRMLGVEEFVIGGNFRRSEIPEMIRPEQQEKQVGLEGVTVLTTTEPHSYDDTTEWSVVDIDPKVTRSNSTASTSSVSSQSTLLPK